jgi:hypothetical protein
MNRPVRDALTSCALLALAAVVILAGGGGLLTPLDAHACAVCWGSSADGSTSHGATWGILFLMAMPFTIAGSVGGWLLYRHRHPERRSPTEKRDVPHPLTTQEESAN